MTHATLLQTVPPTPEQLRTIRQTYELLDITQDEIALEASKTSKRGHVGRTLVAHVFADPPRAKSLNVVRAAVRCIKKKRPIRRRGAA